jgi:hypothetical protein
LYLSSDFLVSKFAFKCDLYRYVVAPLSDKMMKVRARLPPLRIPGKEAEAAKEKIDAMRGGGGGGFFNRPLVGGALGR